MCCGLYASWRRCAKLCSHITEVLVRMFLTSRSGSAALHSSLSHTTCYVSTVSLSLTSGVCQCSWHLSAHLPQLSQSRTAGGSYSSLKLRRLHGKFSVNIR